MSMNTDTNGPPIDLDVIRARNLLRKTKHTGNTYDEQVIRTAVADIDVLLAEVNRLQNRKAVDVLREQCDWYVLTASVGQTPDVPVDR